MHDVIDQDILSEKIRVKMTSLDINQTQLSKMAGISPAALSQILSKERTASSVVLVKLANALGVSVDYLLGKTPEADFQDVIRYGKAKELISSFSSLTAKDQNRIFEMIELLKKT